MKVLFFLGFPNPFLGAAWTRIGFFADQWSKNGHSIEILGIFNYTSLKKRGARRFGKVNIFNLIFHIGVNSPSIFILNSLVSFIISMVFLLARRPDIVIISVPTGDTGIGAMMACKLMRVRYVIDYRDEWENYAINLASGKSGKLFYSAIKKFATILYAGGRTIMAVTTNFEKSLIERGLRNVKLVPNGADIQTFKPSNIRKKGEAFVIFYSGSIGGYYRLDIVVRALKRLIDKGLNNIRLVIAGAGEIQKILNLAKKLGLSNHVKYAGSIYDKSKLASLMTKADAGIIPFDDNPLWKNAIPAKFYEYCACGLPVIATVHNDSHLQELIEKYKVGVTSPPCNEEKLAEAIYWLYENKPFREIAGKRARQLIEEKFDRSKIAKKCLNIIENML